MRKIILAALGLFLAICLMACGATSGDVYAKDYEAAYVKYVSVDDYVYICTPVYHPGYNGQAGYYSNDCKHTWVGSHDEPRNVPECYKISFKNGDGDKGDDCVSRQRYETIQIGDFYEE